LLLAAAGEPAAASTLDQRLLADAADGTLDDLDFISACLIAGGPSDPAELAAAREQYARLNSPILTGSYQADTFDLRQTIRTGNYNCLSAAAIHWERSRRAGVELQIWSRPGHVWLVNPTTSIAHDSAARQITPLALVGKFYYNRGLVLLQAGRHAEGLACMRNALRLDPADREARGNLLAGLNNWAAALCREQRFGEARLLIDQGLAIDAGYAPLVAHARYLRAQRSP
jgi:tetratricopeptide (TPR) repeat protein